MEKEIAKKFTFGLNFYFNLIIAVPLAAFAYLYLENHAGRRLPLVSESVASLISYIFPLLIIVLGGAGIIFPGKEIKKIKADINLTEKLKIYKKIQLFRYMIFDASGILAILAFYLTTDKVYAILYVIVVLLFSLNRPTASSIVKNLKLTGEEKELFSGI